MIIGELIFEGMEQLHADYPRAAKFVEELAWAVNHYAGLRKVTSKESPSQSPRRAPKRSASSRTKSRKRAGGARK